MKDHARGRVTISTF